MATGDLYEIKLLGLADGQAFLNVFHYLQTSGAGGAPQLEPTWRNQVWSTGIRPLLHQSYILQNIAVRDMADPTDFDSDSATDAGSFNTSGDSMPSQDALSFTYIVNRLDARAGGKRFGTYGELGQDAGSETGGMVFRIAAAEASLESNISDTSLNTWKPVVYGKRTGSALYFSNPISNVRFFGFTTQNNRKFYTSPGV